MDKIWQSLLQSAQQTPGHIAVMEAGSKPDAGLTYGALVTAVQTLAEELSQRQYRTLALFAGNSADWIIVDLACRLANVVLLPLPRFFSAGQLHHALRSVPADAVLVDRTSELYVPGVSFECEADLSVNLDVCRLQHYTAASSRDAGLSATAPTCGIAGSGLMLPSLTQKITFTSGSTGEPKGVCLSAEHQEKTAFALSSALVDLSIKKHLSVLPYSTLLENIAGIYAPLLRGASIVTASDEQLGFNGAAGLSMPDLLGTISRVRPDSMILMPQLLQALVTSAARGWKVPDSLRFIAVGGGSVHRTLLDKAWELGLPVFEGYGLSECGSVVALNTPAHRRNGSVGKVLPHARIKIVNGELCVTGAIFLGYAGDVSSWTDPQRTDWIQTGDLCETDVDGFLYFKGRRKNILVSTYGRNISPEWIENEITAEAAINQAFVFGDNRPFCIALLAAHSADVSDADIEQAIASANKRLPQYAQIRRWWRLPGFLASGSGAENDLMTTNGRPRRDVIAKHFRDEIDGLYNEVEETPYAV